MSPPPSPGAVLGGPGAAVSALVGAVLDAGLELALGSACAACGTPGRALCRPCTATLPTTAAAAWPTPTPPGLVRPAAAGEYAGTLRALVLAHKENGRLALAQPLGRVLAAAVADSWQAAGSGGALPQVGATGAGVVLVPVPSHPTVVRERGHDPLLRMTRVASAQLRRWGLPARVALLLRVAQRPEDQAGLDAAARQRNLEGRFVARVGAARPPRDDHGGPAASRRPRVVIVDDVVTTGATLREAQRALEAVGVAPVGAAAVAATRRRVVPGRPPAGPERGRHGPRNQIGSLP